MSPVAILVIAAMGTAALLLRPVGGLSVVTTGLVGAAGAFASARLAAPTTVVRARRMLVPLAVGLVAVLGARAAGSPLPIHATVAGVLALIIAGIGEEAFFRGMCFRALEPRAGVAVAVALPAVVFALIHIPGYGADVVPVDLAAGLVLGWQRWTSGTWIVPAITHVVANLMQLT